METKRKTKTKTKTKILYGVYIDHYRPYGVCIENYHSRSCQSTARSLAVCMASSPQKARKLLWARFGNDRSCLAGEPFEIDAENGWCERQ